MARETQRERIERCLKDIEANPERAGAHYNLGLAHSISGRVKQAEEAYLKAVELDPELVQAWVNLGGVRMMHWDFEGCLEANQKAVALKPELIEAHFNMGQAYLYLNKPESLLSCNQKVLELDRDHPAGHYFMAVAHLALDNHGAAERHLGRAIELGHTPPPEMVKAMEAAARKKANQRVDLVEISGAKAPEKNTKED